MLQFRSGLFAAAMAAVIPAQTFVTSPSNLDVVEGNATFAHFTSTAAGRRFHQVDNTHVGSAFLVQSLGFRRDGRTNGGGTNVGPRTPDFGVPMGLANFALLQRTFDSNFLGGSRQIVYTKKPTNLPSWTGNAGIPAPFDFVVPLDTPFFYVGPNALIIDFTQENLVYTGGTGSGTASIDREYTGSSNATGSSLGTGCTATGGAGAFTQTMRLENNGTGMPNYGMRLRVAATRAPASTPVILNIDLADANLSFPGLCGTLNALPTISLSVGLSDVAGAIPETSISFAHTPAFVGATLVTQFLSPDFGQAGIPIVVSNGVQAAFPANASAAARECLYGWSSLPTNNGTLFFGGGVVMQLGL